MVNCSKCGLNNPTGSKFCSKCGNSLHNNESITQQSDTQHNTENNNNANNDNNRPKSGNKTSQICLGIIAIIILLAIIGSIFGNSQPINIEEIEPPTGFFNGSANKTQVMFVEHNTADPLVILYNDNKEDIRRIPSDLEDQGSKIIKDNKYEIQNFEVYEVVYLDYDNKYSNLYFIQFDDKWYTVYYLTDHINYDVTNTNNPVNQVITSMINQYQS